MDISFNNTVFQFLTDKAQQELSKIMVQKEFSDKESIIQEGAVSDSFYLLTQGQAIVSRAAHDRQETYFKEQLNQSVFDFKRFQSGRLIGECGYFDDRNRTQNVVADGPCITLQVRYQDLADLIKKHPDCEREIIKALGFHVVTRLRNSNLILVDDLREKLSEAYKKVFYNSFLLAVICVAFCFYFIDNFLQYAYSISFAFKFFSNSLIIVFAPFLILLLNHRPPFSTFGMTFKGARKSLIYSFWVSLILCIIAVLVKYLLLKSGVHFANDRVFSLGTNPDMGVHVPVYWLYIVLYVLMTLPQEFFVRGILQTSFDMVLEQHSPWLSIVLSNFIFMTVHVSLLGYLPSFLVFLIGLVWGWMYSKNRTLVGVVLSHAVVGVFWLYFVGFS